ncbi:RNA methyltransferase [Candidatus Uhrbacteria bacterium]|jgi:tRNA (guanosine-2'-O-)-methyltransferase|nr:RNA methyltransferase [Candidatus Uhrbacteria bacterium]
MKTPERIEKIKRAVSNRQTGLTVVIEDMQDPHNAMAVVRTCDALGIQTVHFIAENEKPFNPHKIGKSTSSTARKWVDYKVWDSTKECLEYLKGEGYDLVATMLNDGATSIFETEFSDKKIAVLIGNEREGLSKTAQEMASRHVMIPMRGMVQSLNVSVSAAVVLYEVTRQRMSVLDNFALSEAQQADLVEDFSRR